MDKLTALLYRAIDILLLRHAVRTVLGALLGGAVYSGLSIYYIFSVGKNPLQSVENSWIYFILIGMLTMFIPVTIGLLSQVSELDENIDLAFKTLQKAEKQGVSKAKIQRLRIEICETALKNATIRDSLHNKLD